MTDMRSLFLQLPEVAVITDAYGYILDFNRNPESVELKKGGRLSTLIPGVSDAEAKELILGSRTYEKRVTPISRNANLIGYTYIFTDITAEKKLYEQRIQVNKKLSELINENIEGNEKLREYAMQVKELSDYEEQLQLARHIHDDAGHAITAVHTISRMCLTLAQSDPGRFDELIDEGIEICKRAGAAGEKTCDSVEELLDSIKRECRFPIEVDIHGEEPSFVRSLYELIDRICREAYHNTIDHSMADKLFITIDMSENEVALSLFDNGSFHGEFEKGFGLSTMEDIVHKSGGEIRFVAKSGEGFGIEVNWGKKNE